MRKQLSLLCIAVVGLLSAGCPNQHYDLVNTWNVTVSDENDPTGIRLGDLSGSWTFYSDGTMDIYRSVVFKKSDETTTSARKLLAFTGTYTVDGTNVNFAADYSSSEHSGSEQFDVHYSISGNLVYDGTTLNGTGQYTDFYLYSGSPDNGRDSSGNCAITGQPPQGSVAAGVFRILLLIPFLLWRLVRAIAAFRLIFGLL